MKRNSDESNQKLIGLFLKRVKRSNLVNRRRKTKHHSKPLSALKKRTKAVSTAQYLEKQEILSRTQR